METLAGIGIWALCVGFAVVAYVIYKRFKNK